MKQLNLQTLETAVQSKNVVIQVPKYAFFLIPLQRTNNIVPGQIESTINVTTIELETCKIQYNGTVLNTLANTILYKS